ncbi:FMN-dependent oxidoreductase (nitrilotriacetate monooxygenase family) [Humitalea rosea]|uniref:FMN-dependent oxidoreductase (Nitrilotriacetate monooxygenase family) n=1 Tax=Humitalea rosea TaxID=990373 RepID=A0A2W7K659_9PROT|nr:LLM class flavin-dependent oxidoreductase [Humitalea rosea]PZW42980.1 FMN-dependent oxidoreductase (nitrilotriacetate monooxygenase family) [Humitalea rosea]
MTAERKMALALLVNGTGHHGASWLHPSTQADASTSIEWYRDTALLAERGLFDLFFIADTPAARTSNLEAYSRFPIFMNVFEPVTLLATLAGLTSHIGLGGTVSTSFTEPYNVARQFVSLDHLSHGRAAWNVVTSANDFAARNFGLDRLPPHAQRYERAQEYVDLVRKLWDSWEDDAFIFDRTSGLTFDPAKQHAVDHEGKFFTLHGALNIRRAPQGHPVIIQAGASDTGREFAAETAEIVFSSDASIESGLRFYRDLKGRMDKFGRDPDELKILAGKPVLIADSAQEAEDMFQTLQEMIHPMVGRMRLGMDLETDLSDLPLDEPIPEDRIPKTSNQHKAYFDHIVEMIRTDKLTLRQLYLRYERGNKTFRGTAMQVADNLEDWFAAGAADGFMMNFSIMPMGLERFVAEVVPEIQRRGLFRTAYTGRTLRENLGLKRPANRHVVPAPAPLEVAK